MYSHKQAFFLLSQSYLSFYVNRFVFWFLLKLDLFLFAPKRRRYLMLVKTNFWICEAVDWAWVAVNRQVTMPSVKSPLKKPVCHLYRNLWQDHIFQFESLCYPGRTDAWFSSNNILTHLRYKDIVSDNFFLKNTEVSFHGK